MNPEDIAQILDEIGRRVGPLGSGAWDILVQGTFAVSLVGTVFSLIVLVAGLYSAIRLWKQARTIKQTDRYSDAATFMEVAAFFIAPITFIAGVIGAAHSLVGVIAPEFRVLENLISALAGAT